MTMPVIPADLSTLDDDALRALRDEIAAYATNEFGGVDPNAYTDEQITAVTELAAAAQPVLDEITARESRAASAAAAADTVASLSALTPAPEPDPAPQAEPETEEPASVTASGRVTGPSVKDIPRNTPAAAAPETGTWRTSMVAAANVPGFTTGQALTWAEASQALEGRLRITGGTGGKPVRRNVEVHTADQAPTDGNRMGARITHTMEKFSRYSGIQFERTAPDGYHVGTDARRTLEVLEDVSREQRLGGLLNAMRNDVKQGKSLVAAAGWCAPSETIYDLCEQETMDGILSLPEVTADRGGFMIPEDGGPDFSSIYTAIGSAGDTHLTEAEVIADTVKVCTEIPCPDFIDVRLGVDYLCLTGSLLQRRGYPEAVGRFGRGALVALAHKVNAGKIAAIVAGSTSGGTIAPCAGGDDAASHLLSAIEVAIVDARYRARMGMNQTMEVPIPFWGLAQLRAAMARRRGVLALNVTDAEIADWFATRGAIPRPVYDWQDAFTGLAGGPGGATPATALPTTMQFLVYPAGTWVAAVSPVVDLDTVYDSTLLSTNQYTAMFVEDGWAVMKMCPLSRVYTVTLDPCGCGCGDAVSP